MKAQFAIEEVSAVQAAAPELRVLDVRGEIDTTNAEDFEAVITERASSGVVVLDLTSIGYCDSAAFAALDRIIGRGGVAVAMGPENPVHRAATLMGLRFHDSVEMAATALGG